APGLAAAPGSDPATLPLGVVVVVTGAGAVRFAGGRRVEPVAAGRFLRCGSGAGRRLVVFGAVGDVVDGAFAGTSFSCGWTFVSRFASARSRFSVVSVPSAVESARLLSPRQAAVASSAAVVTKDAARRRVYFVM